MRNYNVAIVGGGSACLAILDLLSKHRFRHVRMTLIGIADIDSEAPALKRARPLNIHITDDYREFFATEGLDMIIELTGRSEVAEAIAREKPPHVDLVSHALAAFFWEFLLLEDEKIEADKETERRLAAERDHTDRILNNLSDAVLVTTRDLVIEHVNETFLRRFDIARSDVIGKSCRDVLPGLPDPCRSTGGPLSESPEKGPMRARDEQLFRQQGRTVYYESEFTPLTDEGNRHTGWLLSLSDITHRKELELELETSRKKYRDLFQNSREGLALVDDLGRIVEANYALGFMLGYSKEDLEKKMIGDMARHYGREIFEKHLEGLRTLGAISVEMDLVKKNGDSMAVEVNIAWLPEERQFLIRIKDITLQKKLEESRRIYSERLEQEVEKRTRELKASEEETRRQKKTAEGIIYGSPIPMFALDRTHRIMYWNKACEKLTDFTSEEMVGTDRHWEPFFPRKRPLLADLVMDGELGKIHELYKDMNVRRSATVEGAFEAEHFFPQLGLEGTHLLFNAAPIRDDAGTIQGAIVTYQDFTERVKMTQELQRRQAFAQNLIQNSIDGIVATDAKGHVVIYNRGAERIFGYAPEEIMGRVTYMEMLPEETARTIRRAYYSSEFGLRGKIINLEVSVRNKEGETIPVRLSGTLLYERHKEVGSVVFVQDLREVHRLQREKEQVERVAAIGRTVAGLAHYIKNILNGLKGGAYVINSAVEKKNLNLVKKGWKMVERNIDQIANIVMDMLIYSSERKPSYELVDPNDLVIEILDLMEERARLSGVALIPDLTPRIQKVAMDKTAIYRCLLNLVSNAVDACTLEGIVEGEGVVTIRTDSPAGWGVRFQVVDNGTGMESETREKIFTDFYTTKGYKGTGLGLPVTQKIVREHGGTLSYTTEKGVGTTFTILLPGKKTVRVEA